MRVDPPEEIFANKLTALVGRMEERDLVDVYFLERSGLPAEAFLEAALAKDAGATPATLAWLLSEIVIPVATTRGRRRNVQPGEVVAKNALSERIQLT